MRRELLQLAETWNPEKHQIGGYFISSKLDGGRAMWDGGLSRGLPTEEIPWASIIDPKTGQRKKKIKPLATGLWSRYGNVIMAPDWFLNSLPCCFLDGELFAGEGNFQLCRSICAGDKPDPRFNQIKYAVYSAPSFQSIFQSGEIKNANMHCIIDMEQCKQWITDQLADFEGDFLFSPAENFQQEVLWMNSMLESQSDTCYMLRQEKLPIDESKAKARMEVLLEKVLEKGGEGIVLRDPQSKWTPRRNQGILKHKPFRDDEGILVGFTTGRETEKGSRLLGKIGSLILSYNGHRVNVSGLTDDERKLTGAAMEWATKHPGLDLPPDIGAQNKFFKIGQLITFQYMTLTNDGIPREPRYLRVRGEE